MAQPFQSCMRIRCSSSVCGSGVSSSSAAQAGRSPPTACVAQGRAPPVAHGQGAPPSNSGGGGHIRRPPSCPVSASLPRHLHLGLAILDPLH